MKLFTVSQHEDGFGDASWELLASVQAHALPLLEAELADLLARAQEQAKRMGADWHQDLQRSDEPGGWHTVHLTLCGPDAWGEKTLADWLQEPSASGG
ncbi:MAG: hypothetical protein J0L58_05700 [Burkholderiales bacterium]|uniref:hypothetical protein n=1 Tax=Inhella sp. TaxID=1921806 RepID=UPI001AC9AAB6|nr:hypothetical protein [Burkholderiales bacterium]